MKRFYLAGLVGLLLAGCGDNIVDVPEAEKAFLVVTLGCSNGVTVYSIEGDSYVKDALRERSVDAMNGGKCIFTVVTNTEYTITARNSVSSGSLIGSVRVKSGGRRERVEVEIPCD